MGACSASGLMPILGSEVFEPDAHACGESGSPNLGEISLPSVRDEREPLSPSTASCAAASRDGPKGEALRVRQSGMLESNRRLAREREADSAVIRAGRVGRGLARAREGRQSVARGLRRACLHA